MTPKRRILSFVFACLCFNSENDFLYKLSSLDRSDLSFCRRKPNFATLGQIRPFLSSFILLQTLHCDIHKRSYEQSFNGLSSKTNKSSSGKCELVFRYANLFFARSPNRTVKYFSVALSPLSQTETRVISSPYILYSS